MLGQSVLDVAAELSVAKLLACGNTVSASFNWIKGDQSRNGVVFFEFNGRRKKLDRVLFFWD